MEIFQSKFKKNIDIHRYFKDENICFIDIETTGLSSKYNSIYLIGILYFDKINNIWTLNQLFADNLDEERKLLEEFVKQIHGYDLYITYNGETFDIPFINNRLEKHLVNYKLDESTSFDLYKIVKKNKLYLPLENLKLKTLEISLAIHREDIYSGKECIEFYNAYTKYGNKNLRDRVLKHNYDDLFYLVNILDIIDVINQKRNVEVEYMNLATSLYMENIENKGDLIIIEGNINPKLDIEIAYYEDYFSFLVNGDNRFILSVECAKGMVSETEVALYIDRSKLVLPSDFIDSTNFQIPENFILLKVDKNYIIDNLHGLLTYMFTKCLIGNPI